MHQTKLKEIIHNHGIQQEYGLLRDFSTYLNYIMENRVVSDSAEFNLPKKDLLKINLMMSPPEKPKESLGLEPFPRLRLFYVLTMLLGLFNSDEQETLSPNNEKINSFLSLPDEEQYLILLSTFWAKIPWGCPQGNDWDERYSYLTALNCCPIGQEILLKPQGEGVAPVLEGKRLKRIWPICGPFPTFIIPSLRYFGLLEYSLKDNSQEPELNSLTITSLGGEVFKYFRWELTNSPEYLLREAWEKLEEGDLEQAGNLAEEMLEKDKYYPDTYNLLGAIELAKEAWEEALIFYRQARDKARWWMGLNFRESFPFQPSEKREIFLKSQLGLVLAYRGKENWQIAREILLDILELEPEDHLGVKFLLKDTEKKFQEKG